MILITGSTGYIGSHISEYFEQNNIEFIGIDNLSYSYKNNVSKKQKHFFFNISDTKKLNKLILRYKPKTVIHCAAYSYVIEAEKFKKKYILNNVIKTKKFIDTCKLQKIENFIFMSSSNVYSENLKNSFFSENSKKNPKNLYGKNKIIIENYLNQKNFKKLIILRLFNVIGILNKSFTPFKFKGKNYQRLIFKLLQNYKTNEITKINKITKNNKHIFPARDFIDIGDLLNILNKLLYKISISKVLKNTLNVGSGRKITIDKVINLINENLNNKLKLKLTDLHNKELSTTRSSISKICKFLNFKPKINLKNSIKSHIELIKN